MATKKATKNAKPKVPKLKLRDEVAALHSDGAVHSSVIAVLEKMADAIERKRKK